MSCIDNPKAKEAGCDIKCSRQPTQVNCLTAFNDGEYCCKWNGPGPPLLVLPLVLPLLVLPLLIRPFNNCAMILNGIRKW